MFNSRQFYNVNRASVLTPQVRAIWDNMCIGVAVVDADGICEYMNPIQRRADGFTRIPVEGQHITSLYVPHELEVIPTMECLQTGKPLLKKAYWYATSTNFLASTVTDFFPLFDHGRKDGVIAFTIWTGNTAHVSESRRPLKPCNADTPYSYYTFSSIVGRDEALQECIHEARSAATSSSPVMIWGESGTGKELFAQAIHSASSRAGHPFIPVNCAAIPENLLEGILFGTVKGAYTDAPDKPGLFEKANCGTLLFDELNSMPLGLQAKLLRVIQEKRVRRLGSHTEIPINVRIISILNEHPLRAVDQGLLRRDLFYRLAVVGIAVPPLRKRQNDIPLLVRHIINRSELAMKTAGVTLDDEVMGIFRRYPWPGNIRELAHVIEGSLALLDGSDIIATFAADDSGIANKESDVSVGFDTSKFEAPGIYYYHLTERDPGIHGLTATTATYLLKVRVVNDNTSEPDGATFKIDYATLTSLDDNTKSDLITNTYTTHGLTVTKALAGDWADYTDNFIFTLEITDPDADPGRMASVTVQTTSAAGVTSGAEVKPFTNGKVSFSETIRGGDVIKVTGLPTGAAYTITESGLDAGKYTTAWTLDGETLSTEKTLPTQTVGAADTALTVTNTRSAIAPTGLLLDAAPYGAMLALAAGSGLVFFRKRRRED